MKAEHSQGEGRAFSGAPEVHSRLLQAEIERREILLYSAAGDVKWCRLCGKHSITI